MYGKEYGHCVYDEAPDYKERIELFFYCFARNLCGNPIILVEAILISARSACNFWAKPITKRGHRSALFAESVRSDFLLVFTTLIWLVLRAPGRRVRGRSDTMLWSQSQRGRSWSASLWHSPLPQPVP